jgi:hypothetical protein
MTRLLTTTAVLLAIGAVAPAQAKTSIDGLSASILTTSGMNVNGAEANGAAIENEGAFTTALTGCGHCAPRPRPSLKRR